MRIISGATWRRHQQMEQELAQAQQKVDTAEDRASRAEKEAKGHASDAAIVREDLSEWLQALQERQRALTEVRQERDALRRAVDEVVAALVRGEGADSARRKAARVLLPHSESADLVLLSQPPKVHLYLRDGRTISAHATAEAARQAAEADGALPSGWEGEKPYSWDDCPRVPYQTRSLPVWGEWPDRTRAHVLSVDGTPYGVTGTRDAAHEWRNTLFSVQGLRAEVEPWVVLAEGESAPVAWSRYLREHAARVDG